MGRHQHILGRGIGWGTSSEAGRRASSVYFTQEYPAEPSRPRIEQRGGAERFIEVKGPEGADVQEFRNAVSRD